MKILPVSTLAPILLAFTLMGCLPKPSPVPTVLETKTLEVFLVRHGEKVDHSKNPELTEAGKERAVELAHALRSAHIEFVHSSDYIRTRDTAEPTAAFLGVDVELYDPRDLPSLAKRLQETGGRHLIVGHSNSTPSMVELLGGDPGTLIDEESEYDRLYIITQGKSGGVSSTLIRYGEPYTPEQK